MDMDRRREATNAARAATNALTVELLTQFIQQKQQAPVTPAPAGSDQVLARLNRMAEDLTEIKEGQQNIKAGQDEIHRLMANHKKGP